MKLYTAFDLHSHNSYLGIIDENGRRVNVPTRFCDQSTDFLYYDSVS